MQDSQGKENEDTMYQAFRSNGQRLWLEIAWLQKIIQARLENTKASFNTLLETCPLPENGDDSYYDQFVTSPHLTPEERLLLLLALIPAYLPEKLGVLLKREGNAMLTINESIGGEVDKRLGYFMPTVKTYMFLVAGESEEYVAEWYNLSEENLLVYKQVIYFSEQGIPNSNILAHRLKLASEYFNHIIFGKEPYLEFSTDFPVKLLTTDQKWKDLIVEPYVLDQLEDFVDWHEQKPVVKERDASVKEGYLALFYGPPGTGKTMTAALLGERCKLPVYRIDVSLIVSKWVGETGKNIKKLFEKVKQRECILFFDEADSLFSVRTGVEDAQDKYANQEIATLLLEIEDYKGMCILATNLENNIDNAFRRRLQSQVFFGRPSPLLRRKLWQQYLPKGFTLHEHIDLEKVSQKIDVTGANIRNIYKMCAAKSSKRQDFVINGNRELVHYSRLELWKEGRLL